MNCYYHPDRKAKTQCYRCKKDLCEECSVSGKNGSAICSRCLALEAAEEASKGIEGRIEEKGARSERKKAKKERKKKTVLMIQYGLIIVGLIIIAIQVPGILSAFDREKPVRMGSRETDALTDECIRNLWTISRMLQEGKRPGDDILCPASKKPYDVIQTDYDVIVRSPEPGLYGFREIRVSKLEPVPELIK